MMWAALLGVGGGGGGSWKPRGTWEKYFPNNNMPSHCHGPRHKLARPATLGFLSSFFPTPPLSVGVITSTSTWELIFVNIRQETQGWIESWQLISVHIWPTRRLPSGFCCFSFLFFLGGGRLRGNGQSEAKRGSRRGSQCVAVQDYSCENMFK